MECFDQLSLRSSDGAMDDKDLMSLNSHWIVSLPRDDVLYPLILDRLDIESLFRLRGVNKCIQDLVDEYFSDMRTVDLSKHISKLSSIAFQCLFGEATNIRRLVIKKGRDIVTAEAVQSVLQKNEKLEHLDLSECSQLNNSTMQILATCCCRLRALHLRDSVWLSPEALSNIALLCPKLETVDISGCWHVNDDSVNMISSACKGLKKLNISRIYGITDSSIKTLARCSTQLTELNVRDCWRVTDKGIWMLGEYSKFLRVLLVKGCRSVTESSLKTLREKRVVIDSPMFPALGRTGAVIPKPIIQM